MPRQTLIATALLVGVSMLAVAAVVEFYSEDVRRYCVGLYCTVGHAYQKTWTKVGYDVSARKVVSHTGAAYIDGGHIILHNTSPKTSRRSWMCWRSLERLLVGKNRLRHGRLVCCWVLCIYMDYGKFDSSRCVLI
jgi:hypothetical protein